MTLTKRVMGGALALMALTGLAGCGSGGGDFSFASFSAPDLGLSGDKAAKPADNTVIPESEKVREAVVSHVPFSVSLWMRNGEQRQFMVKRSDKQRMFSAGWSQARAEAATIAAYSGDCDAASSLVIQNAIWDPVGVWVVDGACQAGAPTYVTADLSGSAPLFATLPRPRPTR